MKINMKRTSHLKVNLFQYINQNLHSQNIVKIIVSFQGCLIKTLVIAHFD